MRRLIGTMVSVFLLASLLAGCAAPTPQVVETEKVVEKPVVQTVVVEKEKVVEKPVVQTVVVEKEVEKAAPGGVQEWTLVNPEGVIQVEPMKLAPRIDSLEGKTIMLRWNGKHNGDNFLNRVAELLVQKYPTAKIIKLYEIEPSLTGQSGSPEQAAKNAQVIAQYHPDIVIASQCD